jgi:hypothetical protein
MADVKNTLVMGTPWSADLEPDGPGAPNGGNAAGPDIKYSTRLISQDTPYGYDDLPDIAVPKHHVDY